MKLYPQDTGDWLRLSLEAQSVMLLAYRKFDYVSGCIELGRGGLVTLPAILGHKDRDDFILAGAQELLDSGLWLLLDSDGEAILSWPEFPEMQAARQSDSVRKRAQRDRERVRREAQHHVTGGHTTSHDVTRGHEKSRIQNQTRLESDKAFCAQSAQAQGPGQGQDRTSSRPRRKSRAVEAYAMYASERAKLTSVQEQKPTDRELNAVVGPILDAIGVPGFRASVMAYLDDKEYPARQTVPWPWRLFVSQWGKYSRIAKETERSKADGKAFVEVHEGADPYADVGAK